MQCSYIYGMVTCSVHHVTFTMREIHILLSCLIVLFVQTNNAGPIQFNGGRQRRHLTLQFVERKPENIEKILPSIHGGDNNLLIPDDTPPHGSTIRTKSRRRKVFKRRRQFIERKPENLEKVIPSFSGKHNGNTGRNTNHHTNIEEPHTNTAHGAHGEAETSYRKGSTKDFGVHVSTFQKGGQGSFHRNTADDAHEATHSNTANGAHVSSTSSNVNTAHVAHALPKSSNGNTAHDAHASSPSLNVNTAHKTHGSPSSSNGKLAHGVRVSLQSLNGHGQVNGEPLGNQITQSKQVIRDVHGSLPVHAETAASFSTHRSSASATHSTPATINKNNGHKVDNAPTTTHANLSGHGNGVNKAHAAPSSTQNHGFVNSAHPRPQVRSVDSHAAHPMVSTNVNPAYMLSAISNGNGARGAHRNGASGAHGNGASGAHGNDAIGAHGNGAGGAHRNGASGAHINGARGAHRNDASGAHGNGASGPHGNGASGAHGNGVSVVHAVHQRPNGQGNSANAVNPAPPIIQESGTSGGNGAFPSTQGHGHGNGIRGPHGNGASGAHGNGASGAHRNGVSVVHAVHQRPNGQGNSANAVNPAPLIIQASGANGGNGASPSSQGHGSIGVNAAPPSIHESKVVDPHPAPLRRSRVNRRKADKDRDREDKEEVIENRVEFLSDTMHLRSRGKIPSDTEEYSAEEDTAPAPPRQKSKSSRSRSKTKTKVKAKSQSTKTPKQHKPTSSSKPKPKAPQKQHKPTLSSKPKPQAPQKQHKPTSSSKPKPQAQHKQRKPTSSSKPKPQAPHKQHTSAQASKSSPAQHKKTQTTSKTKSKPKDDASDDHKKPTTPSKKYVFKKLFAFGGSDWSDSSDCDSDSSGCNGSDESSERPIHRVNSNVLLPRLRFLKKRVKSLTQVPNKSNILKKMLTKVTNVRSDNSDSWSDDSREDCDSSDSECYYRYISDSSDSFEDNVIYNNKPANPTVNVVSKVNANRKVGQVVLTAGSYEWVDDCDESDSDCSYEYESDSSDNYYPIRQLKKQETPSPAKSDKTSPASPTRSFTSRDSSEYSDWDSSDYSDNYSIKSFIREASGDKNEHDDKKPMPMSKKVSKDKHDDTKDKKSTDKVKKNDNEMNWGYSSEYYDFYSYSDSSDRSDSESYFYYDSD